MTLVVIVIIIGFFLFINIKKYNQEQYKQESGLNFFAVYFNKGNKGEYKIFKSLERIKGNSKIVVNAYIPKPNNKTTEIDVILIHETGLYIIESKNYNGWIFGNEEQRYWTQTLQNGKKSKFYNPIMQNEGHIKHLKTLFPDIKEEYFQSLIVFGNQCTLKKINRTTSDIKVIYRLKLVSTISKIVKNKQPYFNENDIIRIYTTLKKYTNKTAEEKNNHVKTIQKNKIS